METFNKKSIAFWFVLLVVAMFNAAIREFTYKPLLEPYIGNWAHQLSSLTAIILFSLAIYLFLKRNQEYTDQNLIFAGTAWMVMTIIFESSMSLLVRGLGFSEIIKTYYFWRGEMWIFVILSLFFLPVFLGKRLRRMRHQ